MSYVAPELRVFDLHEGLRERKSVGGGQELGDVCWEIGVGRSFCSTRIKSRARIFASPGEQFGPGGETWLRFNFATPRRILEEALGRLEEAFEDLTGR